MRVTSAFSRLLDLPGVWVRSVSFESDRVRVSVALRRRRLHCPKVLVLHAPSREQAASRLGLAASGSGPLALGGSRPAAAAALS